MTDYLDRDDVLTAGSIAVGQELRVADFGLLDAAVARPQATVFGVDAYPDLFAKAAALLQSLARNHALIDGNERTAWAASWTFLTVNGIELDPGFDVDDAEAFMYDAAMQADFAIAAIADKLRGYALTRT